MLKKSTTRVTFTLFVLAGLTACGNPASTYTGELRDGPQKSLSALGEKTIETTDSIKSAMEATGEFVQSGSESVKGALETTGEVTEAVVSGGVSTIEALGSKVLEVTAPAASSSAEATPEEVNRND